MNYRMMGRFIAQILFLEGLFMLPAMFISLACGESSAAKAFALTILLLLVISGLLRILCRGAKSNFYATDGMVCVAVSWIILSLTGCLPFFISAYFSRMPTASFARRSASSFPSTPECPFTFTKFIFNFPLIELT